MDVKRTNVPHPRKARKKRRKPFVKYAVVLVFSLLIIAVYLVLTHKFFNIKYVKVEGNVNVASTNIVLAMGDTNTNSILFNTGKAEELVKEVPGIRDVKIEKQLPNRLYVQVQEVYLLGSVEIDGTKFYVDQDGKLLKDPPEQMTNSAPTPQLLGFKDGISVGDLAFDDERVTQFLRILMQSDLIGDVQKINFENIDNIDIMYKDIVVHFGALNDLLDKTSTLEIVIADVNSKEIKAKEILLNQGANPIVVTE